MEGCNVVVGQRNCSLSGVLILILKSVVCGPETRTEIRIILIVVRVPIVMYSCHKPIGDIFLLDFSFDQARIYPLAN